MTDKPLHCPDCGKELDGNICHECGKAFKIEFKNLPKRVTLDLFVMWFGAGVILVCGVCAISTNLLQRFISWLF